MIDPTMWQALGLVAAIISLILIGIIFALAEFFNSQSMKEVAKRELNQTIISAMMLFILVGLIYMFEGGFKSYFENELNVPPPAGKTWDSVMLFEVAKDHLEKIESNLLVNFKKLSELNLNIGESSSRYSWCQAFGVGVTMTVCGATNDAQLITNPIIASYSRSILIYRALISLLSAAETILALLFGLGIFLRCFTFSRSAGGFLIALGIAFYLVFPVTVLVFHSYYKDMLVTTSIYDGMSTDCNPKGDTYDSDLFAKMLDSDLNEKAAKQGYIAGLMLPAIWFIIPLASIMGFAKIFGSDVDVGAMQRII